MVFSRSLRSLLLLIGAASGMSLLAQLAVARTEVVPAGFVAKPNAFDWNLPEPDGAGDGDASGGELMEFVQILPPALLEETMVAGVFSVRLADRRGATLVGVVQLLI